MHVLVPAVSVPPAAALGFHGVAGSRIQSCSSSDSTGGTATRLHVPFAASHAARVPTAAPSVDASEHWPRRSGCHEPPPATQADCVLNFICEHDPLSCVVR